MQCKQNDFRISPKEWSKNTFGWARAEVVGALVNAVFLFALCFSITIESLKRFLAIEQVRQPKLILLVGGVGLGINLVGLLLFGDVGHGHSHRDEDVSHENPGNEKSTKETPASGKQMNIHGVLLHILADALGSVVVMIREETSTSISWLSYTNSPQKTSLISTWLLGVSRPSM